MLNQGARLLVNWAPYADEYIPNVTIFSELEVEREIGSGGEATVYKVKDNQLAAKIYHNPTVEQEEKIKAMIRNRPIEPIKGRISLAWPLGILRDSSGKFIGYVMYFVSTGVTLNDLLIPDDVLWLIKLVNKGVNINYAIKIRENPYLFRIGIAYNLLLIAKSIHDAGHIIGDVSPNNVLINPDGSITWIDTDSFIIYDKKTGRKFTNPFYTEDYAAPEVGIHIDARNRGISQDYFSLGVLAFMLIMDGYHPFHATRSDKSIEGYRGNIVDCVSYFLDFNRDKVYAIPKNAPSISRLKVLDPELYNAFRLTLACNENDRLRSFSTLIKSLHNAYQLLSKYTACKNPNIPSIIINDPVKSVVDIMNALSLSVYNCGYPNRLHLAYPWEYLLIDVIAELGNDRFKVTSVPETVSPSDFSKYEKQLRVIFPNISNTQLRGVRPQPEYSPSLMPIQQLPQPIIKQPPPTQQPKPVKRYRSPLEWLYGDLWRIFLTLYALLFITLAVSYALHYSLMFLTSLSLILINLLILSLISRLKGWENVVGMLLTIGIPLSIGLFTWGSWKWLVASIGFWNIVLMLIFLGLIFSAFLALIPSSNQGSDAFSNFLGYFIFMYWPLIGVSYVEWYFLIKYVSIVFISLYLVITILSYDILFRLLKTFYFKRIKISMIAIYLISMLSASLVAMVVIYAITMMPHSSLLIRLTLLPALAITALLLPFVPLNPLRFSMLIISAYTGYIISTIVHLPLIIIIYINYMLYITIAIMLSIEITKYIR